ncbi:membrane protein [Companilactobacillus sp. RD055328]|uniref:VIT1/CCC1 transporter family protein n=1 Tax=Companilactobacillus sp. RD055328 TaxID=2916634 RepID=UPI001FC80A2B|nr:VIT family protein [Companilactobacillus sp. RD055328]GKQ42704.1 membrane protein [Companilactobacillus sp. RD055328]
MKNIKSDKSNKTLEERMNVIRAGVLGSNDGILTVVGVLFSVGAATNNQFTIFIAGLADLLACALSMASGEYASVSSQSDSEKVVVANETRRLEENPSMVEQEISDIYVSKGITKETANEIAKELMNKNPLQTILSLKYDIQLNHYVSPWGAAFSSLVCAALGGAFPLIALVITTANWQVVTTILATTVAVGLTGYLSALIGNGLPKKAIIRNIVIGLITIAIHYGIGLLF